MRTAAKPTLAAALVALIAGPLGGCNSQTDTATRSSAAHLNPSPLPLGLPLPEARESCPIAPGLRLTRIIRGQPLRAAAALPCDVDRTSSQFGGGQLTTPGASGPWVFHVLEVDPDAFPGQMRPALANGTVARKATVTTMAREAGALAAVNAGFFVVGGEGDELSSDGVTGDPAGVTVINGELISEAIRGRTTLAWQDTHSVWFPAVQTRLQAKLDDEVVALDGINRAPGRIRNCGGRGDTPTDEPRHDVTCSDDDELILYTPVFGRDTLPLAGFEVVLDSAYRFTDVRLLGGGPIPPDGAILAASGDAVDALSRLMRQERLDLQIDILADGRPLERSAWHMLNGGPRLLRDGQPELTDEAGGFQHPDDPSFGLIWVSSPAPRTLVGRMPDGTLLFVVVDGRQPDWSLGIGLEDAVKVMAHFGASDAMNLDGGGSSTMVVNGALVNQPSDAGGARPVSDAVLFTARP